MGLRRHLFAPIKGPPSPPLPAATLAFASCLFVRPSAVAVGRRSTAIIVKPKVAATSSSTLSPSVDLPPPFWSPIPTFPESPFSQEKNLKSSKWYTSGQSKTIRIAVPAVMGGSNNVFRD
uniref:Uncharacterized protein n=1 Tax=Oryza sativa subsp. japonica TaxID=39947 RepID=Q75IH1_ORYSJ|nr:unknown protein [Oryza sativa Japonica Group]